MTFYFFKRGRKIMGAVRFIDVALNNSGSELVIFHMFSHTLSIIWWVNCLRLILGFTSFVSLPGNMKEAMFDTHAYFQTFTAAELIVAQPNDLYGMETLPLWLSRPNYTILCVNFFMYALYYMHMTLQWRNNYALWVAFLVNDNYANLIEYKQKEPTTDLSSHV